MNCVTSRLRTLAFAGWYSLAIGSVTLLVMGSLSLGAFGVFAVEPGG